MAGTQGISEILEKASKMKTKNDKINYLRENDSVQLRTVLCFALHPSVKIALPDGPAPYKPSDMADDNFGMLYSEARRLYLFCEGGTDLKPAKREYLFIQMLEGIHPKDAQLLVAAKDKKLPYKGLTKAIIEEAYPGIFE
jgi:hypothetical protein